MLLIPNVPCRIVKKGSIDLYGQESPGRAIKSKCGVVKLEASRERTSVRADSSASRGNASEITSDARLLFPVGTNIQFGDKIEISGVDLKVSSVFPRYDVVGRLDHLQVDANAWV